MEQVTGYDYRADIWSLGITALELAKGYAPYAKYPPMKVLLLTIQQPPPSLDTYDGGNSNDYSEMFQNVIKICLVKDPSQRPNCKQVLEHRIFQGYTESLEQHRAKIKQELLDQIPDVGMEHGSVLEVVLPYYIDIFWIFFSYSFCEFSFLPYTLHYTNKKISCTDAWFHTNLCQFN
jgi:serine/threonine protein kinase